MDEDYEAANENIHQLRKDITAEAYLRFAREWVDSGADIIGGCCGITPDHIRTLAKTLKAPPPVAAPDYA
ncbi:MAG: homocysteine S-methyltransferase family protein, partial [Rhodobiaceae bacterium]